MHRARTVVAITLALVAACHDPDPAPTAATVDPAPAAHPKPARDFSIGADLEMRRPIRDGHLTIIPIAMSADPAPGLDYLTLDQGMTQKLVTVREIHSYTAVKVRNRSEQPLLVLGGELVLGGAQDHAFSQTQIIAAGESVEVPVFCVEKDRSEGGRKFHSGDALVDVGLRRLIRFGSQQDVWAAVDKINARLGLSPPTATYRQAAALQRNASELARRARLAQQLDDPRIVGFAAAFDGEVVAVDRFASPALFRAYQAKLLGSYIAGDDGAHHEGTTPSPDDVRRLAATPTQVRATDASFEALAKPPAGT